MNRTVLLHIVERLEGLLGRLPGAIQKPVMNELSPLKELFLQQRPPRFLLTGADKLPLPDLINVLFNGEPAENSRHILFEVFRWQDIEIKDRGTLAILDGRGAGKEAADGICEELKRNAADAVFIVGDETESHAKMKESAGNGSAGAEWNDEFNREAGIIAINFGSRPKHNGQAAETKWSEAIQPRFRGHVWGGFEFSGEPEADRAMAAQLVARLAERLPNQCRVEMVRISRNREAQREITNLLIKSTTAICTAVGAQPIPLADLPILTALQLAMVSGIMYVSGRERSLRAATEFVGAVGANVGAGMLLREGARAVLKFFPGWGNVVCGMVAGAGTYAIGQAASSYFLEGVSLREARRTYLEKRKRKQEPLQLK